MIAVSFSCLIRVWKKAFGISINAVYLYSFSSMMQISITDYVYTVGELETYFDMYPLCLFSPDTVSPLLLPSLFYFRNMQDYITLLIWVSYSSFQCIGLNIFMKLSCFILECTASWDLFPHYFNPALSESCVIISFMKSGCSYCISMKNMFTSGRNAPWSSNWSTSTAYLEPVIMGI